MNICLLSMEFPPDTGWGGIGSYCWEMAHGISELGHSVDVITLSNTRRAVYKIAPRITVHRIKNGPYELPKQCCKAVGINWHKMTGRYGVLFEALTWSMTAAVYMKKLSEKKGIDVIEFPEYFAQGFWLRSLVKAPLIAKLHTPYGMAYQLNGNSPYLPINILSRLEKIAVKNADRVLCCSHALADKINNFWNSSLDIEVIPNPVDYHLFAPLPSKSFGKDIIIGYFGRLERRKGIDVLFDAFLKAVQNTVNLQLWFIGNDRKMPDTHLTWMEYFQNRSVASNLSEKIKFFGGIDRKKLPKWYALCDICVVPSKQFENLPYACLEAMSCGKPVIASDCGGIPEIICDKKNGILVAPNNADELCKAISDLIESESMRMRISKNARSHILDKYTRKKIAHDTIRAYEKAIRFPTRPLILAN